jgi:cytochrome c oxidase cbb3-type subunit 3
MSFVEFFLSLGKPMNVLGLITLFMGLLTAWSVLRTLNILREKLGLVKPKTESRWAPKRVNKALWDDVDVAHEGDVLLDHDYDGIHELDNNLPPWWVWGFYLTIFWGVLYLGYYHMVPSSVDQAGEFAAQMEQLEADRAAALADAAMQVDESNVTVLVDASALEAGKKLYMEKCVSCHLADGGGSVGPNFTDEYWIHGGDIASVFTTIKYGVLEKGMLAWKDDLNPLQMQQVASFVLAFQGTTPAVAKAPQGELWVAPTAEAPVPEAPEETEEPADPAAQSL